jgi:hypothetical protein
MSSPTNFYQDTEASVRYGIGKFEECLKYAGYIPIVSTISGGFRRKWAICEIVGSLALAIIFRQKDPLEFTARGIGNLVQAEVECRRWINLLCLIWDNFVPPVNYRHLLNLPKRV